MCLCGLLNALDFFLSIWIYIYNIIVIVGEQVIRLDLTTQPEITSLV